MKFAKSITVLPLITGMSSFNMGVAYKANCLQTFNDEVNVATEEYESDLEHCAQVTYARHLCREEAALYYNRDVDSAIDRYVKC